MKIAMTMQLTEAMVMAFGNENDNIKDNDNVNDSVNNGTSLLGIASSLSVLSNVCSSSLSFSCSSFLYSIHDFSSSSP